MSHNQERQYNYRLRHLFLPTALGFVSEIIIALAVVFIMNLNNVGSKFLTSQNDNTSPIAFSGQLLNQLWANLSNSHVFEQISLFLLWAVAGMCAYILLFRLIQVILGISYTVKDGVRYLNGTQPRGAYRWLYSLHDTIFKLLIIAGGLLLFGYGILVCFSLASHQLSIGLLLGFPAFIKPVLFSVLAAVLGVRLVVIALCVLSPRFRNFYEY